MKHIYRDRKLDSILYLIKNETDFSRQAFKEQKENILTIAWNTGADQKIMIDGQAYIFPAQSVLPLMFNNTFHFSNPKEIIAWQFNREFYCIIDHDKEVSCAGFLFYGTTDQMFIKLDERSQRKLNVLFQVFEDEYAEKDTIQGEMLRMLLKRLIIMITRLGKEQYQPESLMVEEEDIVRDYNVLVESNFKKLHQVQDYAKLLHKSPKSLSNAFAKFNAKSPLQVIKDRIILEAKRLLYYSDKSLKEISYDLGFEEPASFSRFFKNQLKVSPSKFRDSLTEKMIVGE